jgi:hypothetical protein
MYDETIFSQGREFQDFLDKNPKAKKYKDRKIKLVKRDLSERLFSGYLMYHLKNHVEYKRPLLYDNKDNSAHQLYSFVYFYPPFKFYHEEKGLDEINLYGKPLTKELLLVWYSYSLQYVLNSLVIDVEYNSYSSPVTAERLVDYLHTMVFSNIKGRFPNDDLKSLTYKATILHVMKIACLSDSYDHNYDLACIELIKQATRECYDLTLSDFSLNSDIVRRIVNGEEKGKDAFVGSLKYKLINNAILNKHHMLIPKPWYNKRLTSEFLTKGSQFEPKGSLHNCKSSFLRFLSNIGNNTKVN